MRGGDAKMKGRMLPRGNNSPIAAPFVAECQPVTPQVQLICLLHTFGACRVLMGKYDDDASLNSLMRGRSNSG